MNLLYFILTLPALALSFLLTTFFYIPLFPSFSAQNLLIQLQRLSSELTADSAMSIAGFLVLGISLTLSFMFVALGFIVVGPVQAGMAFVFRNFAREEHAFLWSDFRQHARSNWKQAGLVSLLSLLLLSLLIFALSFYSVWVEQVLLRSLLSALVCIILILFAIMLMYIYQMMVTFDLKIRDLLKNAFLLSIIKLPMNVLMLLLMLLFTLFIPTLLVLAGIQPLLLIPYYLFFAFGSLQMLQHYYINRQIQRFMLTRPKEEGRQNA